MIRFTDILVSLIAILLLAPIFILITVLCTFDTKSPLFLQKRIGRHERLFTIFKFRTMKLTAPSKPSHLIDSSEISSLGAVLRKTKLDELPQLFNVLRGDMSLVGPRPGLPSDDSLRFHRRALNVFDVQPGITGLAQKSNIDMSTPALLAETDARLISKLDFYLYLKLIILTVLNKPFRE